MSKKLTAALSLCALACSSALAQNDNLIDLKNMPINDSLRIEMMHKSIQTANGKMLEHWLNDNKPTLPYRYKDACITNGKTIVFRTEKDTSNLKETTLGSFKWGTLYFSSCSELPVFELAKKFDYKYNSDAIASGLNVDKKSKSLESSVFAEKYMPLFMDGLEPNQWDQMIWLVNNDDLTLDLRLKSLNILQKGIASKDANLSEKQKEYWRHLQEYEMSPLAANAINYLIQDGIERFLMLSLLDDLMNQMQDVGNSRKNPMIIPLGFWSGKDEISLPAKVTAKQVRLKNNAIVFRTMLQSKDFNVNKQDKYGNTILHHMLIGNNFKASLNNRSAANLLRHWIENGAETRLLNAMGESPYALFEKKNLELKRDEAAFMQAAFLKKEY